ncbi:MAG TPA: STAS domain-containing protein [Planctomycetota bacterium]|nr:STAS domain-containing protein [Planctomycetota bacterium]
MLLTISKRPVFGPKGEVVIGQCEPYTSDWLLRLMEDGRESVLLEGNYYDLRQVQMRCGGLSPDGVRKLVEEMKPHLAAGGSASHVVTPAAPNAGRVGESTQILGRSEIYQAMAEMESKAAASPENSGLLLERQERCLIVRFVDPIAAAQDADRLQAIFSSLLTHDVRAYVIDLTLLQRISSRVIRELVHFRESAAGAGRGFAIVTRRAEVVRTLESMNLLGFLPHYEDTAAAVKSLSA